MSVATVVRRELWSAGRGGSRWVIASLVLRSALRGAVIWGVVFGLWVISTIKAYLAGYPTLGQRVQLAHSLQAFSLLIGTPRHAETVAGFTTWRVLLAIAIIGAIWGLLTSTAAMRGDEEAGRWEQLLAGQTTKRRATAQALLGLAGAQVAMLLATAVLVLGAAQTPGAHFSVTGSLLFAVGLVSGAAMFLAVGALTSQLSATRGQAATIAAAVLGASFAIRLVADSRTSLAWLLWLSPLGWVEELRPLQNPQPVALGLMFGLIIACAGLTVLLAGRRDLNASVLRERESGPGNARGLVGPISLALRVSGPNALAWLAGVAAMGWVYGSLTHAASSLLTGSPAIAVALGRLGVREATRGFLGIVFLFAEILIAVIAAGQIGAIRDEEASGRLDNLLVRPVRRATWLASRLVFSGSILVVAGIAAGFFTWLGALNQHTGVSLPKLLEAGLNATVPAIFVLGAGVLVFGLRPRFSSVVSYAIVAWSFLIDLLGSLVKGSDWLKESSLFTHVALAPAANPDVRAAAIIVALGVVAAVLGAVAFQRRDVEYA